MGPRALEFDWSSSFIFIYNFKKIESRGDIITADDSVSPNIEVYWLYIVERHTGSQAETISTRPTARTGRGY
jgi:hypothetical protein